MPQTAALVVDRLARAVTRPQSFTRADADAPTDPLSGVKGGEGDDRQRWTAANPRMSVPSYRCETQQRTTTGDAGSRPMSSSLSALARPDVADTQRASRRETPSAGSAGAFSPVPSAAVKPPRAKAKEAAKATKATSSKAKAVSSEEKSRSRECRVDGRANYIINKGVCFR